MLCEKCFQSGIIFWLQTKSGIIEKWSVQFHRNDTCFQNSNAHQFVLAWFLSVTASYLTIAWSGRKSYVLITIEVKAPIIVVHNISVKIFINFIKFKIGWKKCFNIYQKHIKVSESDMFWDLIFGEGYETVESFFRKLYSS